MFLDALRGENRADRPPVWLMRQAGRCLASFREIRAQYDFRTCLFTPELATKITLLPEKELGVDALVLFSDILVIYEKFLGKVLFPGGRPQVECDFTEEIGIEVFDPIFKTIRRVKKESKLPLIGFAGGPWTVLSYLNIEPRHDLLAKITKATRLYLEKQIEAGVDAIQIFDSWAASQGIKKLREFSFPYIKELIRDLPVPTIFFAKQSSLYAKEIMREVNPTAISVDDSLPLHKVRQQVGDKLVLQGNLAPEILLQSPEAIEQAAKAILQDRQHDPAFIFNLGHGVLPATPEAHVKFLINLIISKMK